MPERLCCSTMTIQVINQDREVRIEFNSRFKPSVDRIRMLTYDDLDPDLLHSATPTPPNLLPLQPPILVFSIQKLLFKVSNQ
ncbi:hypothetical protein J6590_042173 [Homalodisca vitripennis]|nr:hypothetical protein J6590_042173 [Homalodisca vitripennis]